MPKGDTIDLLKNFANGSQPSSAEWRGLVSNALNVVDAGVQTVNFPLNFTSGSSGTNYTSSAIWDEIAPPFVPNLHPNLKVFNLEPHSFMAASSSAAIKNIGTNSTLWEFDTDNNSILHGGPSGSIDIGGYSAPSGEPFDVHNTPHVSASGCFSLVTGPDSGEQTAIATSIAPFVCKHNEPWWIKMRFDVDLHDNVEFFFGLIEQSADYATTYDGAAGAGNDRVGFSKTVHDSDALNAMVSKNGTNSTTAFAPAIEYASDKQRLSLGIWWNGGDLTKAQGKILFYADSVDGSTPCKQMKHVKTVTNASAIPNDSDLRLAFILQTGATGRKTATIEYICGALLTERTA
tara:strand:- start:1549 stop:2589 length:1041 start_codon:yes stop_codon:yes gene_type:complete